MRELSLNILDIVTNSIEAEASRVILFIDESQKQNRLAVTIRDNGRGMDDVTQARVIDPFVTSRTTRSVGMGLPFWNQAANEAGGRMVLKSKLGKGTTVTADFKLNSLNLAPLGDIAGTVVNLVMGAVDVHFCYLHRTDKGLLCFDSYWLLARMAEQDCDFFDMVVPAKKHIKSELKRIQVKSKVLLD